MKDILLGVFTASDPRLAGNRPQGQTAARELFELAETDAELRRAGDADPLLRADLGINQSMCLHDDPGDRANAPARFRQVVTDASTPT